MLVLLIIALVYGFTPSLYTLNLLLQLLYVCACALPHKLYNLFCGYLFPGSAADCKHCPADRHVGDSRSVESGKLQQKAQMLVKINPLVYIVEGYRSAI